MDKREWGRRRSDNQAYPKTRGKDALPGGLTPIKERRKTYSVPYTVSKGDRIESSTMMVKASNEDSAGQTVRRRLQETHDWGHGTNITVNVSQAKRVMGSGRRGTAEEMTGREFRRLHPHVTLEQAKDLRIGQIIYHRTLRNADGTPQRWKVNGRVQTWKRNLNRIKVPLKRGLREYDYLTEFDLGEYTLSDNPCPTKK